MKIDEIKARSKAVIMNTYSRYPIAFLRGEGVYLYDQDGKEYIDMLSGIAVCGLGHSHPKWINRIENQLKKISHTSNLYEIISQIECAEKIISRSFGGKCFFANSGAEVNEGAIKLARLYGQKNQRYKIVSAYQSFHGRTLAALSMTGQAKYHKGFEPLPDGFVFAEYNNLSDFENKIDSKTCAVMIEIIQGEGGVIPGDRCFIEGLQKLCSERDILFMIDEVQTGCARTGKWFAYQHYNVTPDVMTLAKSLAGGIPIGVLVARTPFSDIFQPGHHASTFGGNFIASEAASAFIDIVEEDNLLDNAVKMGETLQRALDNLVEKYDFITERRGVGLMQGLVMKNGIASKIVVKLLEKGIILNVAGGNTLRFLPPLIITEDIIEKSIGILDVILNDVTI